ncbi:MAG: thiamine phosphate synthase [Desulfobacterales bacterium]
MDREQVKKILRFYYITDDKVPHFPPAEQVRIAIEGGATLIQYRNKSFSPNLHLAEAVLIREICKNAGIPLLVNDNIALALQIMADGVHLGQEDAPPAEARKMMGKDAIVGATVSSLEELARTDLTDCDYMGTGPVFPTRTKADAKAVKGLDGFKRIAETAPVPVVAIGGITAETALSCFEHAASGIAVISYISRAQNPAENARKLGKVCHSQV